ncbi:hypothetical protein PG985_000059 [Apiospora marii]|uniref:uncharacterized protein n=1 Tax=Apiospora marii TaxID=335849 RepID=UPI00312F5558
MPAKGLVDLPLECLRAILKEAVVGQCPWSVCQSEDSSSSSDSNSQSNNPGLLLHDLDPEPKDRGSTADIRVLLQWRRVNHIFNQEILLCINDTQLLRPGKWHDITICPWCNCQAPLDSLSDFAASFIIKYSNSGNLRDGSLPAHFDNSVNEVIRQQCEERERSRQEQRHDYLRIIYKTALEDTVKEHQGIMRALGIDHELLPGIHQGESYRGHFDQRPRVNIMRLQILIGQLEPIRNYLSSENSHHIKYSTTQDGTLGKLLIAAAKSGQYDIAQEILDHGALDPMKGDALVVAFEREDFLMLKLLLVRKYRHTSEGWHRNLIESLIIRSAQLDLREMTNTLLDHAEYMSLNFLHELLGIACYHENNDLVRRLFTIHRYLNANKQIASLKWSPDLSYVPTITPFEITTSRGHESTLRLLLEKGVDPNAPCAMKGAARGGHVDIARILHESGAHPSANEWVRIIKTYIDAGKHQSQNGMFISFILDENMLDIRMHLSQSPRTLHDIVTLLCNAEDVAAIRLFAAHGMPMFGDFYSGAQWVSPMYIAMILASQELKKALEELGAPEYGEAVQWRVNGHSFLHYRPFSPGEISYHCSKVSCKAHARKRWHSHRIS